MSIKNWDLRRVGLWCLFPAMIAVAIVLPQVLLPIFLTFALVILLEIVAAISLISPRFVFSEYGTGLPPRSPPTR